MVQPSGGALDPQGPVARSIGELTWLLTGLGVVAFVVFAVVLGVGLLRRRGGERPADLGRPNRFILLGGVAFPTVVLIVAMGFTVQTMRVTPSAAPADALVIEVIGHQWWYEVRYPEAGVETANEVHLPVGRPVEFRLSSADVIHSFWIPELGGKMDLLPEDRNTLVLTADAAGVFRSQCAEFCGLQHAKMGLVAVAEPQAQFAAWLNDQARTAAAPTTPEARRGLEVFRSAGCSECHAVAGTEFDGQGGPDLTHLATRQTLAAAVVPNTRHHLARWITDPDGVKEGTKMPGAALDEADLNALLRYLESLR